MPTSHRVILRAKAYSSFLGTKLFFYGGRSERESNGEQGVVNFYICVDRFFKGEEAQNIP